MKKKTAGRKVNRAKRKFLCYFLLAAVTLTATGSVWESPAETVQAAPSMSELQNSINNHQNQLNNINSQINSLQDEQDLVQEKIDDLNAEIINTMTSIGMKEDEIASKETELADKQVQIDQTQEEYNLAKAKEEKQHNDMITRMRMMYENDSSENYVNLLLQGGGLSGMLNRMDFVESVYEYDRQKLQEYEETKEQVLALWNQLEEEKTQLQVDKDQLEADKADLENQKSELDVMLAKKKQESANYDAEIKKAKQEASVAKALLQQEQKQLNSCRRRHSREILPQPPALMQRPIIPQSSKVPPAVIWESVLQNMPVST